MDQVRVQRYLQDQLQKLQVCKFQIKLNFWSTFSLTIFHNISFVRVFAITWKKLDVSFRTTSWNLHFTAFAGADLQFVDFSFEHSSITFFKRELLSSINNSASPQLLKTWKRRKWWKILPCFQETVKYDGN